MIAFTPTGPLLGFTAATSAPTSVQAVSNDGTYKQQYVLTNTDSGTDAVIGWGNSDTLAKSNAAGSVVNSYYLLRGTQIVITAPPDAYFSGITASLTAVIKVQAGYGN